MKKLKILDVIFAIPFIYYVIRMIFFSDRVNRWDYVLLFITIIYLIFRDWKRK